MCPWPRCSLTPPSPLQVREAHRRIQDILEKARRAFVAKKVLLIKAWSPVHLEEAVVPGHHGRRLIVELQGYGEGVEAAAVLARLVQEAGGRFDFVAEKARAGVAREIEAMV